MPIALKKLELASNNAKITITKLKGLGAEPIIGKKCPGFLKNNLIALNASIFHSAITTSPFQSIIVSDFKNLIIETKNSIYSLEFE